MSRILRVNPAVVQLCVGVPEAGHVRLGGACGHGYTHECDQDEKGLCKRPCRPAHRTGRMWWGCRVLFCLAVTTVCACAMHEAVSTTSPVTLFTISSICFLRSLVGRYNTTRQTTYCQHQFPTLYLTSEERHPPSCASPRCQSSPSHPVRRKLASSSVPALVKILYVLMPSRPCR